MPITRKGIGLEPISDCYLLLVLFLRPTSALGTVALRVPQRQWDAPFATELALCSVDGGSVHHRHDVVLCLTLVRVEQYRKSASTHLLIPFKIRAAKEIPFWE